MAKSITKKEYRIISLSDEGREFVIEERFYIFNSCHWVKYHTFEDNLPFLDYFSAKELKEKLEKRKNNCTFVQREGKIYLTIILILGIICLIACKNFI